MASPHKLEAALDGRSQTGRDAIARARTADEELQALICYLRSLSVVVAKFDPAAAENITQAAVDAVRGHVDAMAQAIQNQIVTLRNRKVAAA